jgi:DNA mismatch repair protein MutL
MDQQAAHERVLFEQFLGQLNVKPGESQQSLFPQTLTLSTPDFTLIMEMTQEIQALGFRFEHFGKNTLLINGIPAGLPGGKEKELVEGLIDQFKHNQAELSIPIRENLARALAKRASIKSGDKMQLAEMQALTERLFKCKNPNYTPDGHPTTFVLDLAKIETYFSRL